MLCCYCPGSVFLQFFFNTYALSVVSPRLWLRKINSMVGAAKDDNLGTFAVGAMERVLEASRESLEKVARAKAK